jgi:hypothetical protein
MLGLYLPYHIISTHPDFSKFLLELEGVADAKLATPKVSSALFGAKLQLLAVPWLQIHDRQWVEPT